MGHPSAQKSNTEFTKSLRANFKRAVDALPATDRNGVEEGKGEAHVEYKQWTTYDQKKNTLDVPSLDFSGSQLQEEREQYDITVKLFYLPGSSPKRREEQTREAIDLVLRELHMPSVDLLIVSFPGVYFDEQSEDCADKIRSRGPVEAEAEPVESQIETWKILERLHDEGKALQLGVSEFGSERLEPFINNTRIRPSVDQINLRDCCSTPKPLLALAKSNGVELLVHNDCSNILPRGTTRELLGPGANSAGILAEDHETSNGAQTKVANGSQGIHGDVVPQWVVKYTAVVRNRGVVENKGYFAVAEVQE